MITYQSTESALVLTDWSGQYEEYGISITLRRSNPTSFQLVVNGQITSAPVDQYGNTWGVIVRYTYFTADQNASFVLTINHTVNNSSYSSCGTWPGDTNQRGAVKNC